MRQVKYQKKTRNELEKLGQGALTAGAADLVVKTGKFHGFFTETEIYTEANGPIAVNITNALVEDDGTKRIVRIKPENIEFLD